jgi:hypothetical protein
MLRERSRAIDVARLANAPVQRRAAQRTVRCNRLILIQASPCSY